MVKEGRKTGLCPILCLLEWKPQALVIPKLFVYKAGNSRISNFFTFSVGSDTSNHEIDVFKIIE